MEYCYIDGRPMPKYRMEAKDYGRVVLHGQNPGGSDALGTREAQLNKWNGKYYLFHDGIGEDGMRIQLAVSDDLINWEEKGVVIDMGEPGDRDSIGAISPWHIYADGLWHMFYIGAIKNGEGNMKWVPFPPYYALKATAKNIEGPYEKKKGFVPLEVKPGTYYSATVATGAILKNGDEYMMFFSPSAFDGEDETTIHRTVSIARTKDLDAEWKIDETPTFPVTQQIENTTFYYEPTNETWFMFTNHVGTDLVPEGTPPRTIWHDEEYTDAIWVYWSKDLNHWDPENQAIVLDGKNCSWANKCIGMPTVMEHDGKLALMYDSPGGDSTSHTGRDIGLCFLDLPLKPPTE